MEIDTRVKPDIGVKQLVNAVNKTEMSNHSVNDATSTPIAKNRSHASSSEGLLSLSAVAATDLSNLAESSLDSTDTSINSIGYNADTSGIIPPSSTAMFESPAKTSSNQPGTPLTPTANLKMLVAAASTAFDRECMAKKAMFQNVSEKEDENSSRKTKSLALLCKKFLQVADDEIGAGKEFSLEMMANSLGINRRRIYDIINVMEALEMISKQSKNWYLWHGRNNLVNTLAKLKAMAIDDPDIQPFLEIDTNEDNKENDKSIANDITKDQSIADLKRTRSLKDDDEDEDDPALCDSDFPSAARSVRYDKSLGVLCQKFVMLFLISSCSEITLEEAGKVLVPDYHDDTIYMALNPPVNPKTKVRRLYDIANILSSLGLIKKKIFLGPHHIKKPGYAWSGPSLKDIEAITVSRKNEYTSATLNKGLMRKTISSRPYLHQYEVKNHSGSAPNSPAKSTGTKFKRSLSFGGGPGHGDVPKQLTVVARPLCPKQIDYLREMKEFETEMQKHSHRYPHVASIFHEFLQKYQSTLEQSASANGRFILPKIVPQSTVTTPMPQIVQPAIVVQELGDPQNNGIAAIGNYSSQSDTRLEMSSIPPSTMPSCRYEQISLSNSTGGYTQLNESVATTYLSPKCYVQHPDTPRESCAVKEKEKALQRLMLSSTVPNLSSPLPVAQIPSIQQTALQPTNKPQVETTSDCSVTVNSNIFTNLANSILVNVLGSIQNPQINVSSTSSTTLPVQYSGIPVNQTLPTSGFIQIDDLLVKPTSNSYIQPQQLPLSKSLVSQRPISSPLELTAAICRSTPTTINPNTFLTAHSCIPTSQKDGLPGYYTGQIKTSLCSDDSACEGKSPPKRPRLE